jgi:hypothetical protein
VKKHKDISSTQMRWTQFQIVEKEGNGDGGFSVRDGAETGAREGRGKKKKESTALQTLFNARRLTMSC